MIDREQIEDWKMTYHDPYDGAPVVDDAYKQDFSVKYAKRYNDRTVMSMVREFATVMGQEPDSELYGSLIDEEYGEWDTASYGFNREEELKELADLTYVIYAYAASKGWDLDEAIRRVHKNNVERCIQADGSVRRRQDGKILKRTDAPKVNLEDLV